MRHAAKLGALFAAMTVAGLAGNAKAEEKGAAVIGMFISAMFYQVLHFRHLWALLGLVAAPAVLRRMARRESGSRVAERRMKAMLRAT